MKNGETTNGLTQIYSIEKRNEREVGRRLIGNQRKRFIDKRFERLKIPILLMKWNDLQRKRRVRGILGYAQKLPIIVFFCEGECL